MLKQIKIEAAYKFGQINTSKIKTILTCFTRIQSKKGLKIRKIVHDKSRKGCTAIKMDNKVCDTIVRSKRNNQIYIINDVL